MATTTATTPSTGSSDRGRAAAHRQTTETKHAFKTTEFLGMVAVIAGILISAAVIKGGDDGTDQFIAKQAWLYVAIVAGAYFISRGLAKSGSREPYYEDGSNAHRGDGHRGV
ncbi:hypothetical protein SK069_05235 [Patulibacter brassicae]|uniref:Uncharacterized protein n=1 Tax=Patulibacter brassicae TaxID=1705717 RepID=A0ABU4VH04_9ACTN|nr:hypothetical protein [Patulibacter brassicae]MDX8150989.1 hypothetical protein [Patulibacter brassicae]